MYVQAWGSSINNAHAPKGWERGPANMAPSHRYLVLSELEGKQVHRVLRRNYFYRNYPFRKYVLSNKPKQGKQYSLPVYDFARVWLLISQKKKTLQVYPAEITDQVSLVNAVSAFPAHFDPI